MKTKEEIHTRLLKLRTRYEYKYISSTQEKTPHNCCYNLEVKPSEAEPTLDKEYPIAPRIVSTLVVIQPQVPVRLCMYGSDDPGSWNGDICDSEEISRPCRYFTPRVTTLEAKQEFTNLLMQDSYVLQEYPDLAALQWVINDRVYAINVNVMQKLFMVWERIRCLF